MNFVLILFTLCILVIFQVQHQDVICYGQLGIEQNIRGLIDI